MGVDLLRPQNSRAASSTFWEQPAMAYSVLVTDALTSMILSLGNLLEYSTMPALIVSLLATTTCTDDMACLMTRKHRFLPCFLELCTRPRMITVFPTWSSPRSYTSTYFFVKRISGSHWDLLSSRSPKRWADISLGSLTKSSSFLVAAACLKAIRSAFLRSFSVIPPLASPFSAFLSFLDSFY